MSSFVTSQLIGQNTLITPEGGIAVKMLNKTGGATVKGTIVETSSSTADAVEMSAADCVDPIGIIYEDGVPDGQPCWVVISGKAYVLLENSTTATKNYWARTSITAAGRADITNALPSGGTIGALEDHFSEIGHCLEDVTAGTDKLCLIIFHLN